MFDSRESEKTKSPASEKMATEAIDELVLNAKITAYP